MVADEIIDRNVIGEVAEVGVFRGNFARLINEKFPDRKMYLFDSFESFNQDEFSREVINGNCLDYFKKTYLHTSVEYVLSQMKYPNICQIRKGFFPDTAKGLEDEKFAFVSLDVDLEESIFEGLKWFYPRLSSGGVIFLHDYNNYCFAGVKKAIKRYEKINGTMVKVPIADEGGTCIIYKV